MEQWESIALYGIASITAIALAYIAAKWKNGRKKNDKED